VYAPVSAYGHAEGTEADMVADHRVSATPAARIFAAAKRPERPPIVPFCRQR
jgi:hypothetical protein